MNTAKETLELLRAPVPKELISIREDRIRYIAWYDLVDLLSERTAEMWDFEIDIFFNDGRTIIIGKLTIHCTDFSLVRQSTGQEENDRHNIFKPDGKRESSYGDPTSNAEAMAFRRCCAKFGLGLDLCRKKRLAESNRAISSHFPTPKPTLAHNKKDPTQPDYSAIKKWQSPRDAIMWAQTMLPSWDLDYLQESFQGLPTEKGGKKATIWVDWVWKRKLMEGDETYDGIPH